MATTYTPNYHLGKQEDRSDKFLMSVITDNMDIIDEQLKATDDKATAAAAGLRYKGAVNYYSNLPNNAEIGDAYTVLYAGSSGSVADGTEYVWGELNGTAQWIDFSKDAYTKAEVNALLTAKQDVIADLSDIRTGAGKGATAVQPGDIGTAAKKDVPVSGNASTSQVVMGNDSRLSDSRTPTAHNQAANTINAMTGYSKPSSTSAIGTGDTLNAAIGKLEKKADDNTSNILTVADSGGKKNIFTTTVKTSTIEGCTFTNNGDGTWTTTSDGAITKRAQIGLTFTIPNTLGSGTYVISGCAAGGGSDAGSNYDLYVWDNTNNTRVSNNDYGDGREFNWTPDSTHNYSITIDIRAGKNPNGLVFKPMICTKAQWDISHTFQPYAMTNAEITAWILAQS